MYTPEKPNNTPEDTKNKPGQTPEKPGDAQKQPETQPENTGENTSGTKTRATPQVDETSRSITPPEPDITPKDTTRDAGERWETESPAVKGHPQQNIPEDVNAEETENPDGDDEDLLKKRDETGIA